MSYSQTIKTMFLTLAFLVAGSVAALSVSPTLHAALSDQEKAVCEGAGGFVGQNGSCQLGKGVGSTIQGVSNTLMIVVGLIAVIMIIIGGIRYATSGGDQAQITAAKNTILYSIIGLVVAFMAYGIAQFVMNQIG